MGCANLHPGLSQIQVRNAKDASTSVPTTWRQYITQPIFIHGCANSAWSSQMYQAMGWGWFANVKADATTEVWSLHPPLFIGEARPDVFYSGGAYWQRG